MLLPNYVHVFLFFFYEHVQYQPIDYPNLSYRIQCQPGRYYVTKSIPLKILTNNIIIHVSGPSLLIESTDSHMHMYVNNFIVCTPIIVLNYRVWEGIPRSYGEWQRQG